MSEPPATHNLQMSSVSVSTNVSASLQVRHYFSTIHVQTAVAACRRAWEIEASFDATSQHSGDISDLVHDHHGSVMVAIFMTVGYLEATVNELFADALGVPEHLLGHHDQRLPKTINARLAESWVNGIERTSTLSKYQLALILTDRPSFGRGIEPFQSVNDLIELRNYFVHFRPEWISDQETHKIEKRFRSKRLRLNPILPSNPYFPDRMLSWGLADWAVHRSLEFTDEFYTLLGLRPQYDHLRARLTTRP